jgi:hypothetical protein
LRELGGRFVCNQNAIRLALHDIIRGDHLDRLETKSAARGKEAADPFGFGNLWNVWKRIL